MSRKSLRGLGEKIAGWLGRVRVWLRGVMPRVAAAAAVLFLLRLLLAGTRAYHETPLGLLGLVTLLAVSATLTYYGLKFLVRLKRALLWRVRRRLVITYLFVGLTPVVLLLVLGLMVALGGSAQAMARVVTVQLSATERQALGSARALADALLAPPAGGDERAARAWLEERAGLLRSATPGARVAVWRGEAGPAAPSLGEDRPPDYASAPADAATRGVGFDTGEAGEPLPAWLAKREEWSGLSYLPPPRGSRSAFGTPSVRALVRRSSGGRSVAVLVTVPVSRALVEQYRESTGVHVRPFFLGVRGEEGGEGGDVDIKISGQEAGRGSDSAFTLEQDGETREVDFGIDQFGEPIPSFSLSTLSFPYPVFLDATDWTTGDGSPQLSFMVDWSWAAGGRQFWSDAVTGQTIWRLLYSIAVLFLVLELLALFSAAWMTRAVTGTVHKLYRATEFITAGDFSHRIRTRSRDQLGELAQAFNDMSADIESLLKERVERERLEREIEIAAEVQAQLFPRSVPALKTAEVTGECRAARGVAGDYYDYIEVAPGLVAFALGDVAGKGISASLVMSNLQAALRAQAALAGEREKVAGMRLAAAGVAPRGGDGQAAPTQAGENPVALMAANINDQLCRSTDLNRFATLFLALYDDRSRMLRYTNAGHNAPLLVRAGGRVEHLTTGGTVVGAFDWVKYEEGQVELSEGDVLVIFSDGISEALGPSGEEFGEERVRQLAARHRRDTVENIRRTIFDEVDRWSGAAERDDDQTLVILKAVTSDRARAAR
ncbi:MAG TPA: SpoIIE family protein phosphatase [Pyrinomonadaceae bacterium]|nr:SpoIIE family protein phosphatase [Pyrinomonadaceae bacterium]